MTSGNRDKRRPGSPRGGRGPLIVCIVALLVIICSAVAAVVLLGGRADSGVPQDDAARNGGETSSTVGEVVSEGEIAAGEAEAEAELNAWIEDYLARSDVRETLDASSGGMTEAQACAAFSERGFDASAVMTTYESDGSYHDAAAISRGSDARHPAYSLWYVSASGEYWNVACYGDCFTATPVGRNMDEERVQTVLSEQEGIVSYDSAVNTLYWLVPPEEDLTVHKVDQVSAAYLDSLSPEEVGAL